MGESSKHAGHLNEETGEEKENFTPKTVLELFKEWDANGDGVIGHEELAYVLKKAAGLDDDEITVLFEEADANKDGQIQYEEFVSWLFGCSFGSENATIQQIAEETVFESCF